MMEIIYHITRETLPDSCFSGDFKIGVGGREEAISGKLYQEISSPCWFHCGVKTNISNRHETHSKIKSNCVSLCSLIHCHENCTA